MVNHEFETPLIKLEMSSPHYHCSIAKSSDFESVTCVGIRQLLPTRKLALTSQQIEN